MSNVVEELMFTADEPMPQHFYPALLDIECEKIMHVLFDSIEQFPQSETLFYYYSLAKSVLLNSDVAFQDLLEHQEHPFLLLLEDQLDHLQRFSGNANTFPIELNICIEELEDIEHLQDADETLALAQQKIKERQQREEMRLARLMRVVERMRDSERAKVHKIETEMQIIKMANGWLTNMKLPPDVIELCQGHWYRRMELCYLRDPAGNEYRESIKVLNLMKQCFGENAKPDSNRFAELMGKVSQGLSDIGIGQADVEAVQVMLLSHHEKLSKGEQIERVTPQPMEYGGGVKLEASDEAELIVLEDLEEEHWYRIIDQDKAYYAQLWVKAENSIGQYIFFDGQNSKVLELSPGELVKRVYKNEVEPYEPIKVIETMLPDIRIEYKKVRQSLWKQQQKLIESDRLLQAERKKEEQRKEQERLRVEAEEKARIEREEQEALQKEVARVREDVLRLRPGARLEFQRENNAPLNLKLQTIVRTNGHLIFVDKRGRKAAEYKPDDLALEMLNEKVQVVQIHDGAYGL